jgi:hypothetical protein
MLSRISLLVIAALIHSATAQAADGPQAKPQPPVTELKVEPASFNLSGPRDSRRFVVRGKTADGSLVDLTRLAKLQATGDCFRLDGAFLEPVKDGQGELVISAAGLQAKIPVAVKDMAAPAPVSFALEIMPILARAGCNAGTCHGGQKGRNGFKLSLRGYDPAFDYEQIVEDIAGRRIDRKEPANSLVLLKPTMGVPHEGKMAFDEKSRLYRVFNQWIAEGCVSDVGTAKRTTRIETFPLAPVLGDVEQEQQIAVIASYPDGSSRDVTREAVFTSSNDNVCTVTADGLVKSLRKGETAILIRYEGQFAVNPISVLTPNPNFAWNNPPANNYIDELVYKKLQRIKVLPSELTNDADFLRRVFLDLIGVPPSPEEVRAFLADGRETKLKRREAIDKLMERPEFIDFWTLRLADLMQVNRKFLGEKGTWAFREWIRQQIKTDRPWNEMAYDLLTGVGGTAQAPESAFFRIAREPGQAVENATHLFLGIRFNCNKCHDHPFERWTQGNYYNLAAFFGQVGIKKGATGDDEIIYERRDGGEVAHPKTNATMKPEFPFAHAGFDPSKQSVHNRREALAKWMTAPENPYFAKAMANRLWGYLLGRGIIDPVDDIRAGNPACNAELLDAMTADFVKNKMSIKHMIRTIAGSRIYQLSIEPNATNADDVENFSRARPRRLTAEQLLDSVRAATGTKNMFPGFPSGTRAAQLPDPTVGKGTFLEQFGMPVRESPCECERRNEMSLGQALALVNGPTVSGAVAEPNGRIAAIFKDKADDKKVIEELFLAALCRFPTEQEQTKFGAVLAKAENKQAAAQDILWALLNTSAFLFNR